MKWTLTVIIFIHYYSFGQTSPTDTLTNAKAYAANYIRVPIYGLTSDNKAYTVGFKLNWSGTTPLPMTVIRVNLDDKTTSAKDLSYTLSSTSFYWRSVMNGLGEWYLGLNSANRKILKLNLKDSIKDTNLGTCFSSGTPLAYSMARGRDGNIYIGGSSDASSTQVSMINYLTDSITKWGAVDGQDYTISVLGDSNWIYTQTGQSGNDFRALRKSDGYKKLLFSQGSLINVGALTTGIWAQYPYPLYSKATDTTLTVGTVTGTSMDTTEFNGTGQPTLTTFYDEVTGQLFWTKNGVTDSMAVPSSYQPSAIRRVYPDRYDTSIIYYIGDYYGVLYKYNKSNNTTTALGHLGINTFDAIQLSPTKWYFIGYPSSQILLWDATQTWTAETYNHPLSASTNPKQIGFGRTTSDVHEPQKIIRFCNGLFAFGGNEIRTGNTVGFNWYDSATNTLNGLNGDHFSPRQYQDITVWKTKMILSTSSTTNHGKLFVFDGLTKTLADSLDFSWKNMGYVFTIGDRLYGIAQDTSNIYATIDSTRFYIINLSTKTVVYNQKVRGTIASVQWMPDGYIGLNFTKRTAPDQPLIDATLPTDFFNLRRLSTRSYQFNGVNTYYATDGMQVVRYTNITQQSEIINVNSYIGIQDILLNLLY